MGKVRSQVIGEYSIFIAAIIAALVGMQVYFSRSLQGKHKQQVDSLAQGGQFFSPAHSNYSLISQTLPYEIEREVSSQEGLREKNKTNQVSRVVGGGVDRETITIGKWVVIPQPEEGYIDVQKFFDSSNSLELNEKFEWVKVETDYSLNEDSLTSVVDDFSHKRLAEDKIFK